MNRIWVVIVNYNSAKYTQSCLKDLFKQRTKNKIIPLVINNSPTNDLKNIRKKYSKKVNFISLKKNLGFAKAVNKGIRIALYKKATHILLLNPDVSFPANLIDELVKNKEDIVAPLLKFAKGKKTFFDFGGLINWTWGRTHHLESTKRSGVKNTSPDFYTGCCLLIKKEVFGKIGFFDERFFMYFEDVDFCLRAKKAGFKLKQDTAVELIHFLKHDYENSFFTKYQILRSNLLFILKYQQNWKLLLSLLYWKLLVLKVILD